MLYLLCLLVSALGSSLKWMDRSSGAQYDWSSLRRPEPFVVVEPQADIMLNAFYTFTFGQNLPRSCTRSLLHRTPASAVLQVTLLGNIFERCEVMGLHDMQTVALLQPRKPEAGLTITYLGGELCSSTTQGQVNAPRQVSFQLICDPDSDSAFEIVQADKDLGLCHHTFRTHTKAGCPVYYAGRYTLWTRRSSWL